MNAEAPEGYLPYQGADSAYNASAGTGNPNRYAFGWVGKSIGAATLRNWGTVVTSNYLRPEKTSPWTFEYTDSARSAIDVNGYNRYFCNCGFNMNFRSGNVTGKKAWYPIKLTVSAAGTYNVSFAASYFQSGPNSDVYFVPATEKRKLHLEESAFNTTEPIGSFNFYRSDLTYTGAATRNDTEQDKFYEVGTVTVPKPGDYYMILAFNADKAGTPAVSGSYNYYYHELRAIKLTKTGEAPRDTAGEEFDTAVEAEKNVDVENSVPVSRGEESATVSLLASDVEGNAIDADATESGSPAIGAEYNVTAADVEGYTFLYWAKGIGENKRFVSSDKEYSFKPTAGRNILTAIYRKNDSQKTVVVFYNGNGEEISRRLYNAGDDITIPNTPAMAGFGYASAWTLAGKAIDHTAGSTVRAEGVTMSFVAKYGDVKNITVTTNATVSDANPKYGDDVTVTASLRDASGAKVFAYWEKDGEIVSFDKSYTFKAWKNTVVNAVYAQYQPVASTIRKILMNTFDVGGDIAVMAEFIIPDTNIREKGIVFGTSLDDASCRVAMSGNGNYFTVIDDVADDPVGYVILTDGSVIYSK